MWTWLKLGFSVPCLMKDMVCLLGEGLTKSVDKGTWIIYSQGPERPTKMSGNKARDYFLTAVQICIEKFVSSNKYETLSGWWQNLLGTIVREFVHCVPHLAYVILQPLLKNIFYCRRPWSFLVLKKTFLWALTINLAVSMGNTQHSNCFLRLPMYGQWKKTLRNRVRQVFIPLILQYAKKNTAIENESFAIIHKVISCNSSYHIGSAP